MCISKERRSHDSPPWGRSS
ncbi:hypothetical protein EYF80_062631 [Liparis tanakae]|uniref:Uncharacterized protein n=1 Tax=Liparis tanakae TaxID=230148 RepID=A0A4Z2EEN3_9TELE|nr:hypothetical protein EYF80_062631 [Liparis tanakae]